MRIVNEMVRLCFGGGGGPSIAHLRDSYFERMKDSILLFVVLERWRGLSRGGGRTDLEGCDLL